MGWLDLTPENFTTGELTQKQMEAATGFRVETISLDDAPRRSLFKDHATLQIHELRARFPREFQERSQGFYRLLQNLGMTKDRGGTFTHEDAQDMALAKGPIVRSTAFRVKIPSGRFRHFNSIMKNGIAATVDNSPIGIYGKIRRQKMPKVYYGTISENIPVGRVWKKNAAVVLVNGKGNLADTWALELGLPVERVRSWAKDMLPNEALHRLRANVHELWHLRQVRFDSIPGKPLPDEEYNRRMKLADFNDFISEYHEELDTAMAERSVIGRANCFDQDEIARELIMDQHKLYMGLLFNSPRNWYGLVLNILEEREKNGVQQEAVKLPDFYQVHQSVMEIRLRLMAEADRLVQAQAGNSLPEVISGEEINRVVASWRLYPGADEYVSIAAKTIAGIPLTSDMMMINMKMLDGTIRFGLDNMYLEWRDEQFYKQPEVFYTLLQQAYDKGLFEHNEVTQAIAGKILVAANYFDPELTQVQNVQDLVRLPPLPTAAKEPAAVAVTAPLEAREPEPVFAGVMVVQPLPALAA